MVDYHFVYKDVEGASTQWDDDIQRKLGNPTSQTYEDSKPKDKRCTDKKIEEELEDDPDLDNDQCPEEYRKKRLAEMRKAARISMKVKKVI
uniref:Uncharacterized protein n=1 Tax=Nelumbo nucifera TaxID=4432 RepID=A0A822ZR42_NELNU|nr:TPA_asm: hypothetical protein HUJ06_018371 [Nelumbo nucifera]